MLLALWASWLLWLPACASQRGPGATAADDLPHAGEPEAEELSCSRDVECVLVNDCCGCARGGMRTSVRADRLEALTERTSDACEQQTCAEQPSEHRSCDATAARCLGGRCVPAL